MIDSLKLLIPLLQNMSDTAFNGFVAYLITDLLSTFAITFGAVGSICFATKIIAKSSLRVYEMEHERLLNKGK